MTYPLDTMRGVTDPHASRTHSPVKRWAHEGLLLLAGAAWVYWVLAQLSYSPWDAAWSTSGQGEAVRNWGGRLGAS